MAELPKILAPIDFSECSPALARYAGQLSRHFRSEFTLLHVQDSTICELSAREAADPAIRKLSDGWRGRAAALLANFPAGEVQEMNVRRIVLSGGPAEVIVDFARFERTSLIVIPTHGSGPLRRCLLGSVVS